jgi:hypothetical protein
VIPTVSPGRPAGAPTQFTGSCWLPALGCGQGGEIGEVRYGGRNAFKQAEGRARARRDCWLAAAPAALHSTPFAHGPRARASATPPPTDTVSVSQSLSVSVPP